MIRFSVYFFRPMSPPYNDAHLTRRTLLEVDPETSPGLGLQNPGGGIHIWKWRKRGNITDDINTGVYKGSPRS